MQSQTALNTTSYAVAGQTAPIHVSSGTTYLMYSAEDLHDRGFTGFTTSQYFAVVQYNGGQWQYDNGSTLTNFTPCPSDVLVAAINPAGPAITPITQDGTHDDTLNGIVDGYSSVSGGLGFSISGSTVTVTAGTLTALAPQVTRYFYASDLPSLSTAAAGWTGNELVATVYPDCSLSKATVLTDVQAGTTAGNDIVAETYYANGAEATATDQRGVVHTYLYDNLGRETDDEVTSLGFTYTGANAYKNVNGGIRAIVTAYNDSGQTTTITSYNSPAARASTNVVNQIAYSYDGWGNVETSEQAHSGAATTSSPTVAYNYDTALDRLDSITYPTSGTGKLDYDYGPSGSIDKAMSLVSAITDASGADVAGPNRTTSPTTRIWARTRPSTRPIRA